MRIVLAMLFLAVPTTGLKAADSPIKPFLGEYKGEAVSKNRGSIYFGTGVRGFGVKIVAEGDGFCTDHDQYPTPRQQNKTTSATLNLVPASRRMASPTSGPK